MVDLRNKILRRPLGLELNEEDLASEASSALFGAWKGSQLVGCLMLTPRPGCLQMRQVAVDSGLQGQGIGAALVRASEEYATRNGHRLIILHARETAIKFYLRLGYLERGPRFTEVGLLHQEMFKQL